MKIFICLLVVLIFLFFLSTIKINIKNLEKSKFSSNLKFNINLGLYLFGIIKLLSFTFKDDGMKFLFLKISYRKLKFDKMNFEKIKQYQIKDNLKNLKWQIEKMNFKLNIGFDEVGITVFLVVLISTFFSVFSAKYSKQINMKNYIYQIKSIYNKKSVELKISLIVAIKIINIIKTIINFKMNQKQIKNKLVNNL